MGTRDFLKEFDDMDLDLSEVNDILNEDDNEELEMLKENPLKSFQLPNRSGMRFSTDTIQEYADDRKRLEMFLKMDMPLNKNIEKIDPLDLLHKKELHEATMTDKIQKTSLKDKRQYQEAKLPVMQFEELKLISLKIAPPSSYNAPMPSSQAVSKSYIIIGSRSGQILIFNHSGQELKTIKAKKNFGQVTCLEITDDEIVLASGYHFGQIALWEIKTGKCIRACNTLHNTPVLTMCFWDGTFSHLISGELCGRVMMVEYGKSFISSKISQSELFYDDVGSVLSIQRLIPDPNWPHPTDTAIIVAIVGTDHIIVFDLLEKPKAIFKLDRPCDVPNTAYPCISWKRAMCPEDSEPIDHILAVAWGERISLYRFKFALAEGVTPAGFLETESEIKAISWLSFEILFVIGKSREIRVISSREMNKEIYRKFADNKKAILDETYANRDLAYQSYTKKDGKDIFIYYNTIKCYDRLAMLLGNRDYQKGRLLNWKECIDELSKKNEWLEVLALGIDLYTGKGKKLYGLPKNINELRSILEENVKKYIKISTMAWTHKISNAIEFCISIESLELLFVELFDTFIDQGGPANMKLFMDSLEPFILNKEIRNIPHSILGKMMGYYLNAKSPQVLERIVLNLEPECIDPRFVLPACEEHNLLTTYIFISTHSQPKNYINPLDKIYQSIISCGIGKTKIYLHYKLLWYFRMCIRGQLFPNGEIDSCDYKKVVADVTRWIIQKDHMECSLQNDFISFLSALWSIFEHKDASEIIKNRIESAPSFQNIIDALLEKSEKTSYFYYHACIFILKAGSLKHVDLNKKIYMKTVKYLLKDHKFAVSSPVYATNIDDYIINYSLRNDVNLACPEIPNDEKGSLLLILLKKCGDISAADIEKLHNIAIMSDYTEVMVYLLELKKEYSKCVMFFVKCQSDIVKKKVFAWINEVFTKISEDDRDLLKKEVMIFLKEFVEIDSDLTAKIVTDWYHNDHLEIIKLLDSAPKLQMKYLGELAKDILDEELVFKYVVLLCENEPSQVYSFLSTREDYNTNDCLKECLKYNIIDAAAYLHERLGSIQDALNLLLEGAKTSKKILSGKVKNREAIPKTLIDTINTDIRKSIELCLRNANRLDLVESEEYWFQVLHFILSFYKEFEEIFLLNPSLEPIIHKLIKEVLEHMISYVDFKKVIGFITRNFSKIPFKHFKENIYQVLAQNSYQANIVKQAINLLGNDVKGMTKNLYNYRNKGVALQRICAGCGFEMASERMFQEKFIVFICGHGFHMRCAREHVCALCLKNNQKKGQLVFISNGRS